MLTSQAMQQILSREHQTTNAIAALEEVHEQASLRRHTQPKHEEEYDNQTKESDTN
jgi:hypothetical protein